MPFRWERGHSVSDDILRRSACEALNLSPQDLGLPIDPAFASHSTWREKPGFVRQLPILAFRKADRNPRRPRHAACGELGKGPAWRPVTEHTASARCRLQAGAIGAI
jgi:hypothetical protein